MLKAPGGLALPCRLPLVVGKVLFQPLEGTQAPGTVCQALLPGRGRLLEDSLAWVDIRMALPPCKFQSLAIHRFLNPHMQLSTKFCCCHIPHPEYLLALTWVLIIPSPGDLRTGDIAPAPGRVSSELMGQKTWHRGSVLGQGGGPWSMRC